MALEWLHFQDWKRGGQGKVRHVRNGGEVQVLTPAEASYVDGFGESTNTVFELHRCYFHSCPRCFKKHRWMRRNCHKDRSIQEMYEATCRKTNMLPRDGYTIVEQWECQFKEDQETNTELKSSLQSFELVEPMNPRDNFYGRRTGAVSLYAKADPEEEIKYCDVMSRYHWVNKYKEYPVCFPIIYTNPTDKDISHYFGVAKVDVLAPEKLFHPVLPIHAGGNLTFPLCAAFTLEEQVKPWLERSNLCSHTDKERTLRGT